MDLYNIVMDLNNSEYPHFVRTRHIDPMGVAIIYVIFNFMLNITSYNISTQFLFLKCSEIRDSLSKFSQE